MPGPKPGTPRPTREQVLHRENRAWDLRVNHAWTQQRIAAEIGVSHSAVDAISRLARRVTKQLEAEVRSEIVRQLAILNHIVDEAMQAWEASKAGSVEQETTRGPGGRFVETTTWRSSCGESEYLQQVMAALDAERRAVGPQRSGTAQYTERRAGAAVVENCLGESPWGQGLHPTDRPYSSPPVDLVKG